MGKRLLLCGLLVFSKGGREGGLLPGNKSFNLERNAKPNHGMTWKLSLLPGNLWGVCLFVCLFSEPLQLPYGRGWGPGIHTKTSRWGWNKCANARPRDNSKIAFYCHLWLRPKLQQCYQILFEGDVYLKCILLARNVVFKIGWIDFFILWKKGWDK